MKVIEYFSSDRKQYWLSQIEKCEWKAGLHLAQYIKEDKLIERNGSGTLVLLLVEDDTLIGFCTYSPVDEIQPTELSPWIGFVFVYPEYRGHRYAGILLDWCECMATVMGREYIYIATGQENLYDKFDFEFIGIQNNYHGEPQKVYRKPLQLDGPVKDDRKLRGSKYKNEIVAAAKKNTDMTAVCGFSCSHCFLTKQCGGCRSYFNCCGYGTLYEKCACPNVECCKEKGIDGCYDCENIRQCNVGFYSNGNDGNAAKAQALFIHEYGKDAFMKVQDNLHKKYDFKKVQEILGYDIDEALRILKENM